MKNIDIIRGMDIDEMADWITNIQEILIQKIENSEGYYLMRKKEYRKIVKQWLNKERTNA